MPRFISLHPGNTGRLRIPAQRRFNVRLPLQINLNNLPTANLVRKPPVPQSMQRALLAGDGRKLQRVFHDPQAGFIDFPPPGVFRLGTQGKNIPPHVTGRIQWRCRWRINPIQVRQMRRAPERKTLFKQRDHGANTTHLVRHRNGVVCQCHQVGMTGVGQKAQPLTGLRIRVGCQHFPGIFKQPRGMGNGLPGFQIGAIRFQVPIPFRHGRLIDRMVEEMPHPVLK